MNNKYAVVSNKVPQICSKLEEFGYKLIYTESVDGFISYEKNHADIQCITVDDKVFVLNVCCELSTKLREIGFNVTHTTDYIDGIYPNNVRLNAKIIGSNVICKEESLDSKLKRHLLNNNYNLINVNQGYAACSCVKVNENAIITADNSIYRALKSTYIDVLKIHEGYIDLYGAGENTHGFLGGASVLLNKSNLLFFGDIRKHPAYDKINSFCRKRNVNIHYIDSIQLTDIGGAVLLNI
ncbi:MAG: hypothetical protein E7513_00975 [Ruminococcaceae bacterium]|nr:hypothetical protein [Oscillospiraceae bacterium]